MTIGEESELVSLIDRTIDTSVPEPFGAYLFLDGDPAAQIARSVERTVFLEAFGNTAEILASEYGPYESSSLFACIIDHRARRAAGTIRLILPTTGGPGLKSLVDVAPTWGERAETLLQRVGIPSAPGAIWDAATLCVAPRYRSAMATGLVSLGLYQTVVTAARSWGVEWLCAILDAVVYRVAQAKFASPFDPYADGRPYLGSAISFPVTVELAGWKARMLAREPELHDIVYEAVGIGAALRPVSEDVAADLVRKLLAAPDPGEARRPLRGEAATRDATRAERAR